MASIPVPVKTIRPLTELGDHNLNARSTRKYSRGNRMATRGAVLDATQSEELAIKPETFTHYVYVKPNPENPTKPSVEAVTSEDAGKKLEADGYMLAGTQRSILNIPGTWEGFDQLFTDREEGLAVTVRGIRQKYFQKYPQALTKVDSEGKLTFPFTADDWDTRELLQEPTRRRITDEFERTVRDLRESGLDPKIINPMIEAAYKARAEQLKASGSQVTQ